MTTRSATWIAVNLEPDWQSLPSRPSREELAPGFLLHAGASNNFVLDTGEGLLVIDPGHQRTRDSFYTAVRTWSSAPVRTVVFTHGHVDHVTGFGRFLSDGERPQVVAQENCLRRFRRYHLTRGFNEHINRRQSGNATLQFPETDLEPTLMVHERLSQRIGDLDIEYRAVQGETDDCCVVWISSRRMLFVGDLATWKVPNSGNPLKVQRYPIEWADALEEMAGLGAEWLCPGHDLVLRGEDHIRTFLLDQAAYLRSLIHQVLEGLNAGRPYDEILHKATPDPAWADKPHIRPVYNHPQFIVRDLLRYWGGWWDGEGANLLPMPRNAQAQEIVRLAGGIDPILERVRQLVSAGDLALACHLIDWVTQASPESLTGQRLRNEVYQLRADREIYGMARGFFLTEAADARRALEALEAGNTSAGEGHCE